MPFHRSKTDDTTKKNSSTLRFQRVQIPLSSRIAILYRGNFSFLPLFLLLFISSCLSFPVFSLPFSSYKQGLFLLKEFVPSRLQKTSRSIIESDIPGVPRDGVDELRRERHAFVGVCLEFFYPHRYKVCVK